jgi:hypothetical protein
VEALIKEKKEKDNVINEFESVSLLNYKKLRRRTTKVEKKKLVEANKEH